MAPKRKAPAANGRTSKRVASGVSTPVSRDSDGDFDESEEWDESEKEAPHKYDSQSTCTASHSCLQALTMYAV